ncbi:MAG: hypothetical protein Q3966_01075 [Neisseria sp.]|nr:hypothetical protein [Neisseria sp.]
MPICACPHCKAYMKVKDSQMNVAQGFVRCTDCQGLFKAKDFVYTKNLGTSIDFLPDALSDIETVRKLGAYVRGRNAFTYKQTKQLLEHPKDGLPEETSPYAARPVPLPSSDKGGNRWTVAALAALTVLVCQMFYILLNR